MANIGPMPAINNYVNYSHGNESVPYGLSNLATTTSMCLLLHRLVVSALHLLPLPFQLIWSKVRCFSSFLNILRCYLLRASVLFYYFIFFALSQLRMLESGCPNLILEMMDEVNGRKYYRRSQESQKVSN